MRFTIAAVSLFASVLPTMKAAQPQIDLSRLLECISEIEGGAATDAGGRPCMNYGPWSDRTDLAHQLSRNETAALPIFLSHLRWIVETLPKYKVPVTPESIATTWRYGIGKAAKLHGKSDYGKRASALMSDPSFNP